MRSPVRYLQAIGAVVIFTAVFFISLPDLKKIVDMTVTTFIIYKPFTSDEHLTVNDDLSQSGLVLENCPEFPHEDTDLMRRTFQYLAKDLSVSERLAINDTRPVTGYLPDYRSPCWLEELPWANYTYDREHLNKWYRLFSNGDMMTMDAELERMTESVEKLYREREKQGVGWRVRCLPFLYIIGMQKAGTTDLFGSLYFSELMKYQLKETLFWNNLGSDVEGAPKKFSSYIDLLTYAAENASSKIIINGFHAGMVVDASTHSYRGYASWKKHPWNTNFKVPCINVQHHIKFLTPKSYVILMLRHPIKFLESCYNFFFKSFPHRSVHALHVLIRKQISQLQACLSKSSDERNSFICYYQQADDHYSNQPFSSVTDDICHVRLLLYHVHVKQWASVIGKERFMVIKSEEYFKNRPAVVNRILDFFGEQPVTEAYWSPLSNHRVLNNQVYRFRFLPKTVSLQRLAKYLNDPGFASERWE